MVTVIQPAWKEEVLKNIGRALKRSSQRYKIMANYIRRPALQDFGKKIRHALKAEVFQTYWPRSGRYCEAGLFDRYDMMQRCKVIENDTRHVLKAEVF